MLVLVHDSGAERTQKQTVIYMMIAFATSWKPLATEIYQWFIALTLFKALYGKQIQFCTLTSSPTVHSLPKMVMLWILTPFLTILVEWEVMGVGVPSTRAQAPTVLPHPTMEYSTQASCLISASSKTMASLTRTPGPMRARGPIETLGPSLAVG